MPLDGLVELAEAALIARWQLARLSNDAAAARQEADFLVRVNRSLVGRAVRRYRLFRLSREDLVQAGQLGLLQALERFDPARGRFAAYATYWIRKEAQRSLAAGEFSVAIPAHLPGRLVAIRSYAPEEGAIGLGLSPGVARSLRSVLEAVALTESGGEPVGTNVGSVSTDDVFEKVELDLALSSAVGSLDKRLRDVVVLTHGLADDQPRSTRQVAALLGVSDFTVRSRLARAHRLLAGTLTPET